MPEKLIILKSDRSAPLEQNRTNQIDVGTGSAARKVVDWLLTDNQEQKHIKVAMQVASELSRLKNVADDDELGLVAMLVVEYLHDGNSKNPQLVELVNKSRSSSSIKTRVDEMRKAMEDYFDNDSSDASGFWQEVVFEADLPDIVFWTMCELEVNKKNRELGNGLSSCQMFMNYKDGMFGVWMTNAGITIDDATTFIHKDKLPHVAHH